MQIPVELVTVSPIGGKSEPPKGRFSGLQLSPLALGSLCVGLVVLLGYLDYWTGYEQSLLLFYLAPIALATWFSGFRLGIAFSILSVVAWVASDIFAGVPTVGFWNVGMVTAAYVVFTLLLSKLRTLLDELELRVRDRTKALRREIAERQRLDREIAEVADRERHRLGQELHDGLCQHLTGTALTAQSLREKLASRFAPEMSEADKVVSYIEQGIDLSRNLARGFFSPELEAEGLPFALRSLAENTSERFGIFCTLSCKDSVHVPDSSIATHLYRIAQEAVMNAVKHAEPSLVEIQLLNGDQTLVLRVTDDGVGLPEKLPQPEGLGLRLMSHGAGLLGAEFRISRNSEGGTSVTCNVPIATQSD